MINEYSGLNPLKLLRINAVINAPMKTMANPGMDPWPTIRICFPLMLKYKNAEANEPKSEITKFARNHFNLMPAL